MTIDTGVMAAGTIIETIGAETTGVETSGAESKPTEKPNAVVNGSAAKIGPCGTATRTITATIVANATQREQATDNMGVRTSLAGYSAARRHDPSGNSTCRSAAAKATFSPSSSSGMQ